MEMTKKQINYFNSRINYWKNKLGVTDYRIDKNVNNFDDNALAKTSVNIEMGVARITLTKSLSYKCSDNELDLAAFHEICEVIIGEMNCYMRSMFKAELANEVGHRIIRRLENTVYPLLRAEEK